MSQKMQISVNRVGKVRKGVLCGKVHDVVPMVMMVEGVLAGCNTGPVTGPLYYPKEALGKFPQAWNNKPVLVNHPKSETDWSSADVLNQQKVGIILNTRFDGKRLRAEAWLDPDLVSSVDSRVSEAIANKTIMEVSTGLFSEVEVSNGEFAGKTYDGIVRNIYPDHLAILPDQVGACSVADGAGLLQNQASDVDPEVNLFLGVCANEVGFGEIRMQLASLLNPPPGDVPKEYAYIEEVFGDYFVYEQGGAYFKRGYSIKDDVVSLTGLPESVKKVVVYTTANEQEKHMDKQALITQILSAENSQWKETDRAFLEGLSDQHLQNIAQTPPAPVPASAQAPEQTSTLSESKNVSSVEEFLNSAPPEMREVLLTAFNAHKQNRDKMEAAILSNAHNTFTKSQLASLDFPAVEAIFNMIRPEDTSKQAPLNYAGVAAGNAGANTIAPMAEPSFGW